jgi:hypothetical protein
VDTKRGQKYLSELPVAGLANCYFASLARPKMLSGANAFEISDIQEEETEV